MTSRSRALGLSPRLLVKAIVGDDSIWKDGLGDVDIRIDAKEKGRDVKKKRSEGEEER